MIDDLVVQFHTPDQMGIGDKIKLTELFLKQRGLLQPEKSGNFIPVEINFISAGEVAIKSGAETITMDVAEIVEPQLLEHTAPIEAEVPVDDPFDNLMAMASNL